MPPPASRAVWITRCPRARFASGQDRDSEQHGADPQRFVIGPPGTPANLARPGAPRGSPHLPHAPRRRDRDGAPRAVRARAFAHPGRAGRPRGIRGRSAEPGRVRPGTRVAPIALASGPDRAASIAAAVAHGACSVEADRGGIAAISSRRRLGSESCSRAAAESGAAAVDGQIRERAEQCQPCRQPSRDASPGQPLGVRGCRRSRRCRVSDRGAGAPGDRAPRPHHAGDHGRPAELANATRERVGDQARLGEWRTGIRCGGSAGRERLGRGRGRCYPARSQSRSD